MYVCMYVCICMYVYEYVCVCICSVCKKVEAHDIIQHFKNVIRNLKLSAVFGVNVFVLCACV